MIEYEKIETLYNRDSDNPKKVTDKIRLPEFLLPQVWHVTEKVDGMNLRVIYKPVGVLDSDALVAFHGRTNNAQLSKRELAWLQEQFPVWHFTEGLPEVTDFVTIYGEFYGPKIQSGGWYREDYGFRVFDVRIGDWWLNWTNVIDVANKLDLRTVPVLDSQATLSEALEMVHVPSTVQARESLLPDGRFHEGIVARTDPLLFMRDGRRLMWKLKVKDY